MINAVPCVLMRNKVAFCSQLCLQALFFLSSQVGRKQNVKLSPDLERPQGPPKAPQTKTDFWGCLTSSPSSPFRAERSEAAQTEEVCYHSPTEPPSLYWSKSLSKVMTVRLCHHFTCRGQGDSCLWHVNRHRRPHFFWFTKQPQKNLFFKQGSESWGLAHSHRVHYWFDHL